MVCTASATGGPASGGSSWLASWVAEHYQLSHLSFPPRAFLVLTRNTRYAPYTLRLADKPRTTKPEWILLIHQLPPKPTNLRMRILAQITKARAVAIKNSVYVLPATEKAHEDIQWLSRRSSRLEVRRRFKADSVEGADGSGVLLHFVKRVTRISLRLRRNSTA